MTWSSSRTAGTATAPARPGSTAASSPPFPALAPRGAARVRGRACGPRCGSRTSRSPTSRASVAAEAPRRAPGPGQGHPARAAGGRSPGGPRVVEQIARLLDAAAGRGGRAGGVRRLVRLLVEVAPQGPQARSRRTPWRSGVPQGAPGMLVGDAAPVCRGLRAGAGRTRRGHGRGDRGGPRLRRRPWDGRARAAAAGHVLRDEAAGGDGRRAGTRAVLGRLARTAPDVRVHLVGHSFGGRLVSFALRGLPEGVRTVKSVTLLQGAFSHYAFAARLPHDARASGCAARPAEPDRRPAGVLLLPARHGARARCTRWPRGMAGDAQAAAGPRASNGRWAPSGARWATTGCRR